MCPTRATYRKNAPQGSGIIDRPRLLNRLKGAFDHKLTLITAPPGFGKTTLVTQLVRHTQAPVAWQTIDERSRDLPNLYTQAINSLSAVIDSITQLAPPFGYSPSELATLITDHLAENLNGELIYVLDDVHQLTGAAPAEAWLRTLVTELPPNCHLILASRTLPRLPSVEMIARGEVLAIGLDELRLTPEEITELGTSLLGVKPPQDQVQQLVARFEGWPAGTVLAFQPLPAELEQMALSGQGGPEALFESLARIMLQAQPLNVRNFLLASSTLSQLTPQACTEALDLPKSAQMLMDIQNRNLFVTRLPGGLVYHTLFRNFLQAELKELDADWFVDLHTRAAKWFEDNDQPDQAFDHYMSGGLYQSAATIAEHMAIAYFIQNRAETLLAWNHQLEQSCTPAPRLAFRCATICIERYDYDGAEQRLRQAEATRNESDPETSMAAICIQYGLIHVLRGESEAAERYVSELVNAEPEPTNIRGRALNVLGLASLQTGKTDDAIRHFEAALPLYRAYADTYALGQLLHNLVIAYWRVGRLTDALGTLHEVIALQRSLGGAGPLAMALNSLGYCYHQLNDNEHAIAALQEGLGAIARFPNRRARGYLLFNLAEIRRDQGEMEAALDLYNEALEAVGEDEPALACTVLYEISTLYRWRNEIPEAIEAAQAADRLARKHKIGNEGRIARLLLWAARACTGQPETALRELELVAIEFETQQERFDLLRAEGLCAFAALLADKPEVAERHLDSASQLSKGLGTLAPLASEVLYLPLLNEFIRQKGRTYQSIINSVDQLRVFQIRPPGDSPPHGERQSENIYTLRVITLGQAHVIRDGKDIPTTEWRPAARDLFLYIVFTKRATREQISLSFWPDSPAKRARDNFHSTMYRIREVLGENTVIVNEDGSYGINPDISIWCDTQELEALCAQARMLPVSDARTEDLWRRAVGLYNGDFLPSLDFEWASAYREHLREIHVETLLGLGRCIQARGEHREAIDIYKRALEAEPYREDIHQAIMTCHIAKGAKHKAVAQLNQLKKLLRNDLGVGPSKETLQLIRSILT